LPIVVVLHIGKSENSDLAGLFNRLCQHQVEEAQERIKIQDNYIYIAPAGYHLLIEEDYSFSLSMDEKVNFSRPSIDVLFCEAAEVYGDSLIGILLTGSNKDGAFGMVEIAKYGGLTIAQDPSSAKMPIMPQAAIDTGKIDVIADLTAIPKVVAERMSLGDGSIGRD